MSTPAERMKDGDRTVPGDPATPKQRDPLDTLLDDFQKRLAADENLIKSFNKELESKSLPPRQDTEQERQAIAARMRNNLERAIESSSELRADIVNKISEGRIEKFDLSPISDTNAGTYSPSQKTLSVHPVWAYSAEGQSVAFYKLVGTIGHEKEHSQDREGSQVRFAKYIRERGDVLSSPDREHDYTGVAQSRLAEIKPSETKAQFGFYNAIALTLDKNMRTPNAVAEKMPARERNDFFEPAPAGSKDAWKLRPGLSLDPSGNGLLPVSETNQRTLETSFYERRQYNYSDVLVSYQNKSGADVIKQILQVERDAGNKSEVLIDLKRLGLDREQLAPLLNQIKPPGVFYDTSDNGRVKIETDKLMPKPAIAPSKPGTAAGEAMPKDAPDSKSGAGSDLLRQANSRLAPLWHGLGIEETRDRDNLSAAVADRATRGGLKTIDLVVASTDGKSVIPIEGKDPTMPWVNRVAVGIAEGRERPFEQSLASIESHQQSLATTQSPQQQDAGQPGMSRGARTL
ncbi:MAG: hypothetical protein HOP03_09655 [Lysobacter sp.]|nr:hypothetical protein [Lysobacter sp.]